MESGMDANEDNRGQKASVDPIKRLVLHEQVTLIYRLTAPTMLVSASAAVVLWWELRATYLGPRSTAWLATILVCTAARLAMTYIRRRSKPAPEGDPFRSRTFFVGTFSHGLPWGCAGTILFPVAVGGIKILRIPFSVGSR